MKNQQQTKTRSVKEKDLNLEMFLTTNEVK